MYDFYPVVSLELLAKEGDGEEATPDDRGHLGGANANANVVLVIVIWRLLF